MRRVTKISKLLLSLTTITLGGTTCFSGNEGMLTFKVIDDEGKPLVGMPVSAGFSGSERQEGRSDTNGQFVLKGTALIGLVQYGLRSEGCYPSYGEFTGFTAVKDRKLQPWNPVITTVVRRIVRPIPMYAKVVESDLPTTNAPSGFDLVAGDWVAPYGKGSKSDILFAIGERRVSSWTDFNGKLLVTFSNEKDGVQERDERAVGGSTFGWLYSAPVVGYEKKREVILGDVLGKGYFESNHTAAAYIRVRTVTNEVGHIVQANYGRIAGPMKFDVRDSPTGWIKFAYWLNPTPNDRNLEFDPKRNLFHNLKSTEQVNVP